MTDAIVRKNAREMHSVAVTGIILKYELVCGKAKLNSTEENSKEMVIEKSVQNKKVNYIKFFSTCYVSISL